MESRRQIHRFCESGGEEPLSADGKLAEFANDPNEVAVQYDLYSVLFNNGHGGTPAPIAGASHNGISNTFPKVSPDGRWIVFVQCRNGQLMRPDSLLYIVPSHGGQPRRMRCNTSLMNSWHSFSPNSRWLVFSSKARSPYTQMYLTHIDEDGNDTPAILIENSTAANRAVNLSEFVNIPADREARIDLPALPLYSEQNDAGDLASKGRLDEAIARLQIAVERSPDNADAQQSLGQPLMTRGRLAEAAAYFEGAVRIKPGLADGHYFLGMCLYYARNDTAAALAQWHEALRLKPDSIGPLN